MQATPRRLKAKRLLLRRPDLDADAANWVAMLPPGRSMLRRLRALRRMVLVLLWALLAGLIQALLIALPGKAKIAFAKFYWMVNCRLIGMSVRVIGTPARRTADGRPIVYVSNHSSWLDIPVLGGKLEACFIAKEEVARWPLIGTLARLGRTVYVRRRRSSTARERDEMRDRLAGGDSLILFPEGTTSDGSRVLPFRSCFLSIAELPVTADGKPALVQPVSVVYDRLSGLPTGRVNRPLFAWYGDMDIGSHFWRLAQHRGLRATVLLHAALDPSAFASRKALAQATWAAAAEGAAMLRQNRPARPVVPDGAEQAAEAARPAYA
ncbi:1-acyl-sn-glycerol-3-phosphate acyltransferase [Rhodovastum atsumiense]|uniref:1-acyl-sn-glycerol-3-phosphate acyltransferase n=1 Tax=Rhodovastum atsumiense TaxID=504468 RepID=A0A5M6IML6_9PROT|nr:lysophospholipid acyltransferase family protein [Rhodovastum atsumiense]KAA5609496.1 1-acyl-sn-glycerol-3-phosphate acyltransferase [Rhodovastum atsumiense]CAH2600806.1 1-acyl-sn-glycerol-3-phosphate acyltransferase [Rhodovastum atsumiense]